MREGESVSNGRWSGLGRDEWFVFVYRGFVGEDVCMVEYFYFFLYSIRDRINVVGYFNDSV